jgi:hypothetical protein
MDEQIFQELFEYHIRTQKMLLEAAPSNGFLYPKLSLYTVKNYDQTMGAVSMTFKSLHLPEQIQLAKELGKKIKHDETFKRQPIGAVFLTMRSFYDTEKTKGNQVLQSFGLTPHSITGETVAGFEQDGEKITFVEPTLGVFGYKRSKQEYLVLDAFYRGMGIVTPSIISTSNMLNFDQMCEWASKQKDANFISR